MDTTVIVSHHDPSFPFKPFLALHWTAWEDQFLGLFFFSPEIKWELSVQQLVNPYKCYGAVWSCWEVKEFERNDKKSSKAPPSMIVRLTNMATQTLGAFLQPSWKTWTLGTSGEISLEKSLKLFVGSLRQQQQEREEGQKWELPVSSRWPLHFNQAASQSPAEKWESNSVASSNSSHFDFSSNTGLNKAPSHQSDIDQSFSDPQTRCSATLGSGSRPPTTLSPFRETSFTTNTSSFWLVMRHQIIYLLSCSVP